MTFPKRFLLVSLLLSIAVDAVHAAFTQADEEADLEGLYQQIDEAIAQSPQYVAEREQHISACRDSLMMEKRADKRFPLAEKLFFLYQSYKNDSALHYAEVCISLADSLQRPDQKGRFRSLLAYQCSNSDLYAEAVEQLRMVDKSMLDEEGLCDYYNACMHLYGELGSYSRRPHVSKGYFDKQNLYRDSLLMITSEDSEHNLHLKMDILTGRRLYQDALDINNRWLRVVEGGTHESAYAAFYRSMVYDKLKNHDMTCFWLGRSAIDDIKCAVMNQASLLFLADHLANDGDISRARRYVDFAKQCNLFFNPQLRHYQVNAVVNVYKKSFQSSENQLHTTLLVSAIVMVLLLLALVYTIFKKKKQPTKQVP